MMRALPIAGLMVCNPLTTFVFLSWCHFKINNKWKTECPEMAMKNLVDLELLSMVTVWWVVISSFSTEIILRAAYAINYSCD